MRHPLLMPAHVAGPRSTYRLFEWCMAIMMVLIAVTLAMPGDTMERAALKPIAQLGFNEENMAAFFGIVGAVRCGALFLNGYINNGVVRPNGANVRAACAALGCCIMGQLTFALLYDAVFAPSASFFLPVLGTLTMGEAVSIYVARMDVVDRKSRLSKALAQLERAKV